MLTVVPLPSPVDIPVGTTPDVELDNGKGVEAIEVSLGAVPLIKGAVGLPTLPAPDPPLAIEGGGAVELIAGNGGDEVCNVPVLEIEETVPGVDRVEDAVVCDIVEFACCEEAAEVAE
jgi:hypothetical protein